ncbi:AAA family ATPase [Phaeobacter gallaeciensis]|uniref:AAA family ATPase n=1 Tax=Phaeobacter gallaeciensis TaxID=60890 RepID=UPI002380828B|nr:AAA family ATPase [Phaeobacter gallaeciensis]MDE4276812.1 AAA family ATPase [Phaeobacter gallaeciensis]MDE4302053.1 AAA family ATPase [Phaeobacter gallaeciensis]MDE5187244.1 AAA family ATPase [Phaeobacter gallaeciensis]
MALVVGKPACATLILTIWKPWIPYGSGRLGNKAAQMITNIRIKRFKSVYDADIELGKVNLFIGGNGAGKSNVLEAIGLASASLSRGIRDQDFQQKGVRLTPPAHMKSAFKGRLPMTLGLELEINRRSTYSMSLTANNNDTNLSYHAERIDLNKRKVSGRSGRGVQAFGRTVPLADRYRSLWDHVRLLEDIPTDLRADLAELESYSIYAPQTEFLRGVRQGPIENPPVGLHGEGLPAAVDTLIRQAHERHRDEKTKIRLKTDDAKVAHRALQLIWHPGWAFSASVGKADFRTKISDSGSEVTETLHLLDKHMHRTRNRLSAYDSSEGTLYLAFIAVLMAHKESPKIFALDNVDNALNPRLTRLLLEELIALTCSERLPKQTVGPSQVFFTSHNPTSLDAFDLFDDDQRVFVVKRSEKGHTVIDRLKPHDDWSREDWERAMGGRNLSSLWIENQISGALGEQLDDF